MLNTREKYHPKLRMSITLSGPTQDKLLMILSKMNIIHESFPEDYQYIMTHYTFGKLMAEIAKMDNPIALNKMNIEEIDIRRMKKIKFVHI